MHHASLFEGIDELDFRMIKLKLMDPEEGEGWVEEFCDRVEVEYRRFMALTRGFPTMAIVPSGAIDKFWHYHILDTQKYGPDCEKVFGFFLHHFPYFGMRGEEDARNLTTAWGQTIEKYREYFGEPPLDLWSSSARCPKCGRIEPFALQRA